MNYKDFSKLTLPNLEDNQKITIAKFSEFGYPIAIQLKVNSIEFADYAQYNNCLRISGTPKRKRTKYKYTIKPYEEFTIYDGWVELNKTESIVNESNGVKVTTLGLCFDENTLNKAMNVNTEILISSKEI